MLKDRLTAIGGGLVSGLLYFAFVSGSPGYPIIAFLTPLTLMLAGLALGLNAATIAAAAGLLFALAFAKFSLAALYALIYILPALVVTQRALLSRPLPSGDIEWYPPGHLLGWLTAIALGLLAVSEIWSPGVVGGMSGAVEEQFRLTIERFTTANADPQVIAMLESVRPMIPYVPAVSITFWLILIITNAVMAQGILVRRGSNSRPSPSLLDLKLPRWPAIAIAIAAVASLLPGSIGIIGQNAAIILAMPFLLLGLSVVHSLSPRWTGWGIVLVLFYLILVLLQWPVILVVGLGLVEHGIGLKRRWRRPDPDEEEEK